MYSIECMVEGELTRGERIIKADLGPGLGLGQHLTRGCLIFYKPEPGRQGLLYFTLIMMEPGTVRATPVTGQEPQWPLLEL